MKKHDDIKLDVTSNIDEKIIDEVTDKKIALSSNKGNGKIINARKRFIAIGSIAASFILILSVLLVIIPMIGFDVPVYQGMTIRQGSASSMNVHEYDFSDNGITLLSASRDSGFVFLNNSNGNGNAYGHDKDNHKDKDDKPKNDIEDIVVIDVKTDDEVRYYVKPGEIFIIEVHIDNPKDYEIQSFTLNGQKYANYMFKEGSTMELLLLEVTAPDEPGYVEYTIDAIKYIDGTEIKDVDMSSGDKSIKAGIAYPTSPSASITSQSILPTSIELSVNVTDPYSLIGENKLAIYLTDGESIISSKPLTVGKNNITFDNLIMNKTYQYGIVTAFDLVDGKNLHKEWLLTSTITTVGAFGISNAVPSQDAITFEVEKIGEIGEITSISLFDAETNDHVASGGADIREFTGLLSNHTYNLYIDFKYTMNGKEITDWVAIKGIKTAAKTEPTITFGDITVTDSTITGKINFADPDSVGEITSVDIYKGDVFAQNNAEKALDFSSLDGYTDYKAVVTYTYDLGNGVGVQTKTAVHEFKTDPHLEFKSCKIINTDIVKEGETIYMQVELDNPSGALPSSVIVNGQEYGCATSTTPNKIFVEIVNDGQFEGGNTTLTVEKVNMTLDGKEYSVSTAQNNSDSVFIRVKLENLKVIESFGLIVSENGEYVNRDYIYPSDTVYLLLSTMNEALYTVDSITVQPYCEEGEYRSYVPFGDPVIVQDPTILANGDYLIAVSPTTFGNIGYEIKITYKSIDGTETASSNASTPKTYRVISDEVKEISTPDDLLNMNGGYYYKQTADIDLDGISWAGAEFNGVFEGGGYSITNMSRVGTVSGNLGLFTQGHGVIKNVNLKKVTFIVDGSSNAGAILGAGRIIIDNCHVDSDSVIIATGNVGGIVGYLDLGGSSVTNCTNSAAVSGGSNVGGIAGVINGNIINCQNYGNISSNECAGGIAGTLSGTGYVIENCQNHGDISGNTNVGGIAGALSDIGYVIENCKNYGNISGNDIVGGIAGKCYGVGFTNCSNYGDISGTYYAGGIVAFGADLSISNCKNYGAVSSDSHYIGGILGVNSDGVRSKITDCVNYGTIAQENSHTPDNNCGGILGCGASYITNCANFGAVKSNNSTIGGIAGTSYDDFSISGCVTIHKTIVGNGKPLNSYALGENVTVEQLNSKSFYTDTLCWSEDIWNLDDLDIENGKYPTLK